MPSLFDYLLAPYYQEQQLEELYPGKMAPGICFGLSCAWVDLHKKSNFEGSDKKRREVDVMNRQLALQHADKIKWFGLEGAGVSVFSAASAAQSQYSVMIPNGHGSDAHKLKAKNFAAQAGKFNVRFETPQHSDVPTNPSQRELLEYSACGGCSIGDLIKAPLTYRHVSLGLKMGDRHTIATYQSSSKDNLFFVFDPNFGEFQCSLGDVNKFFKVLFEQYKFEGNPVLNFTIWKLT